MNAEEYTSALQQPTPNGAIKRMNAAFEAALTENRRNFLGFLIRHLGIADTPEEVLQQFYLRAVSKAANLRKRTSVVEWLYRLLNATLVDYVHREMLRHQKMLDQMLQLVP